jgi:hypothetical protein
MALHRENETIGSQAVSVCIGLGITVEGKKAERDKRQESGIQWTEEKRITDGKGAGQH